jgi:Transposase IS116/IS110/IS902 family
VRKDADGTTGPRAGAGGDAVVRPALARLDEIPGISADLAASIIAEIGLDMRRFPTASHLVSWAGLCPRTIQSGPRNRHGKSHGNSYLRGYLGQAATGAARTTAFLGERYQRIARRRGWRQSKGPARMRCSDAGRPSPGTTGGGGFGQPEGVRVAVKGSWSALFGGSNWSRRMSVHSAWPTPLASTVMPL